MGWAKHGVGAAKTALLGMTALSLVGVAFKVAVAAPTLPLRLLSPTQVPPVLGLDADLWQTPNGKGDKTLLLRSIDHSLRYLDTGAAQAAYRNYPVPGVTRDRVQRSLLRFRTLLQTSPSPEALATAVRREFDVYQSVGKDNQGTVDFTGYFEATYTASRTPNATYRYPLYRLPSGFGSWPRPQPTRLQLEGADGLQGSRGLLRGSELVWLRDRLEAYLVQVQGSARLALTDGTTMTVGVAGKTDYPYTSLGKELVKAGKVRLEALNLPFLMQYFQAHPTELDQYIPRNQRFVFFAPTYGAPATGSIGAPVTAGRSIATDKPLMPPGALALIQTRYPSFDAGKTVQFQAVNRFVLDQDTGGAIKGPGRVDIFMGTGSEAKQLAGLVNSPGALYYLLLKS
ncbi:MAG TPA: MltA domain-containing protein [Stenomitos sp.]